jgi:hypothetical protein
MNRSKEGSVSRARWAAIGAAVAVSLGVGGVAVTNAVVNTGEKAVFVPIAPCRLFDLRPAPDLVGPRSAPLGAGETYTQAVRGANGLCDIPADATAVAMNVTAVGGTAGSFLTIWPSDISPRPLASNLNWVPGSPATPNKVDVKLSVDGNINMFNLTGSVSVLADVVGYYADHNHDDRYFTKTQSETQLATKANTADVYTKTQINSLPSSSVIAGGMVNGNDATVSPSFPRFGTAWTVAKNAGTGSYSITFLGLHPGCANVQIPLMLVSGVEFSGGSEHEIAFASTSCGSGNTSVQIQTFNAAGAAADRGFQFIAYRPGNNQILPTSAPAGATECTLDGAGTFECV